MKLPKVESLIITVFFLCIALWAISKCSSKRSEVVRPGRDAEEEPVERPVQRDTVYVPQPQAQPVQPQNYATPTTTTPTRGMPKLENPPPASAEPAATTVPGVRPTLSNQTQAPAPAAAAPKYTTLFVTIDGLKVRKEPNLKSDVVTRLKLDESVYFLNKKSEKPEEINLGYEKVTDYWVKIRTKAGKEGWVFGAGVHYYKMKRKGVME